MKETTIHSKKRSLEEEVVNQPQKRVRTNTSWVRTAPNSHHSSIKGDNKLVEHSATPILKEQENLNIVQKERKLRVPISESGRFGRTVRLPTRFR